MTVPDALERLVADRDRTGQRLAELQADFAALVAASKDSNADDEHDPEGATIAFERSGVDALIRQARQRLVEIDQAIERVHAGTYGVCASCGGPIAVGRLEARPAAEVCIACAEFVGP